LAALSSTFNQPGAAFAFLPDGLKFPPIEKGWEKKGHGLEEARRHVGNVGILAGNGYIGLDQDHPDAFKGLQLPDATTIWETRPGRFGIWFRCNEDHKNGKAVGEVKLVDSYQVIPPSWKTIYYVNGVEVDKPEYDKAESAKRTTVRADYKLLNGSPPAEISLAGLLSELQRIGITFNSKLDSNATKLAGIVKESRKRRAETQDF
jgi:hypothetical protein